MPMIVSVFLFPCACYYFGVSFSCDCFFACFSCACISLCAPVVEHCLVAKARVFPPEVQLGSHQWLLWSVGRTVSQGSRNFISVISGMHPKWNFCIQFDAKINAVFVAKCVLPHFQKNCVFFLIYCKLLTNIACIKANWRYWLQHHCMHPKSFQCLPLSYQSKNGCSHTCSRTVCKYWTQHNCMHPKSFQCSAIHYHIKVKVTTVSAATH